MSCGVSGTWGGGGINAIPSRSLHSNSPMELALPSQKTSL